MKSYFNTPSKEEYLYMFHICYSLPLMAQTLKNTACKHTLPNGFQNRQFMALGKK